MPEFRIAPHVCPECGQQAHGAYETIPGLAMLTVDDHGHADYSGETKVYWDGQTTESDPLGRITLVCPAGHYWQATCEDAETGEPVFGTAGESLLLAAARRLLDRLDELTTAEFSRGDDRAEREALRAAIEAASCEPATCEDGGAARAEDRRPLVVLVLEGGNIQAAYADAARLVVLDHDQADSGEEVAATLAVEPLASMHEDWRALAETAARGDSLRA